MLTVNFRIKLPIWITTEIECVIGWKNWVWTGWAYGTNGRRKKNEMERNVDVKIVSMSLMRVFMRSYKFYKIQ